MAEWLIATDCKSVPKRRGGSNPSTSTKKGKKEAWQSGLLHRLGKAASQKWLREFESHRFRQIYYTL